VLVMGAGPAGLATAHALAKASVPVEVLELNPYVGGLCRTIEQDGYRFDLGGHRWFTKNQDLQDWFLALMEGELIDVDRTSRIFFDGRFFQYPISIPDVIRNAGPATSALAVASYAASTVRGVFRRAPPKNVKEAFERQFGPRLFEMFFRRYTEKVWGLPCDEISAAWVTQRTKGLSILTTLVDALVRQRSVVSLVDKFVYPRLGYQRIAERMAEDIVEWGGSVHLDRRVVSVTQHAPNDFSVTHEGPEGPAVSRATDVVSTVPLSSLVSMTSPEAPAKVRRTAESLTFRDLVTVTVMLDMPQMTTDTWLYVHDDDLLFARMHEPKNWSPDLVPSLDKTSVVCECFCTRGDDVWTMSDDDLADRVVADLADRLGFITRDQVVGHCIVRTVNAYPVYDLEYEAKVGTLHEWVSQRDGLHVVGRGGTFRYNNADHSIEMGLRLGKLLLGADEDPMLVNSSPEYHEEIVVPAGAAAAAAAPAGNG
jgi:protoporphyrinogen oxidase